jgi:hypothetical protein
MAVRLSALRAGRPLRPGIFPILISVRGWGDPRAIVRQEGLGQLKKKVNDLIGTRSRDLLACSTVSQPTTLPRAYIHCIYIPNFLAFEFWTTSSENAKPKRLFFRRRLSKSHITRVFLSAFDELLEITNWTAYDGGSKCSVSGSITFIVPLIFWIFDAP